MIAENLSSKQYMLKYGINIEVGHVYKNFLEVLETVGLPVELSQSKNTKSRIIESLKEHTVLKTFSKNPKLFLKNPLTNAKCCAIIMA